jgi:uncharacterized protein
MGLLADARAARAYLVSRCDVDPARLVYLGESLGAAVVSAWGYAKGNVSSDTWR